MKENRKYGKDLFKGIFSQNPAWDNSFKYQQEYLEKLYKRLNETSQYDRLYQKEFGQRLANLNKSTGCSEYKHLIGSIDRPSVTSDLNTCYSNRGKKRYFNIETSLPKNVDNSSFRYDPNQRSNLSYNRKDRERPHHLKPLQYNRTLKNDSLDVISKPQMQQLHVLPEKTNVSDLCILPKIVISVNTVPSNNSTPSSRSSTSNKQNGFQTTYRLSSNTQKPTRRFGMCGSPGLDREKTDYESIESISARNMINIDEYFNNNSDNEHQQDSWFIKVPSP